MVTSSEPHNFVVELSDRLTDQGFTTIVSQATGQQEMSGYDLVAGRDGVLYLFAVVTGENPDIVPPAVIDGLQLYARELGAKPRLAVKRYGSNWRFLYIDDLLIRDDQYRLRTSSTNGYGLTIDEL